MVIISSIESLFDALALNNIINVIFGGSGFLPNTILFIFALLLGGTVALIVASKFIPAALNILVVSIAIFIIGALAGGLLAGFLFRIWWLLILGFLVGRNKGVI